MRELKSISLCDFGYVVEKLQKEESMTQQNSIVFFDTLWTTDWDSFWTRFGGGVTYDNSFPPMNVSIHKESKDLKIDFAVAGYKEEEVSVELFDDHLHIEIKPETVKDEDNPYVCTQHGIKRASVSKKFYIPSAKYDFESAGASLKDGLLTIEIPAKESIKPRRLSIASN